jgi:hypothetical protein
MAAEYLVFIPCCNLPGYVTLSFTFDPLILGGTYTYAGPPFADSSGDQIIVGTCYHVVVQNNPLSGLTPPPNIITLTLVPGGCADLDLCGCVTDPCLCSRATNLKFITTQLRYIDCYGVQQVTPLLAPFETSEKYCVSQWITGGNIENFGTCLGNECPSPSCYTLYSCDGSEVPFNTLTDLSLYSDTGVSITLTEYPDVCFLVYENTSADCLDPIVVTFDAMGVDCCASNCYYVNTGSITYVDADGLIVDAIGPLKFCSDIYPVVDALNGSIITEFGACTDDLCPQLCYVLTDCDGLADPIYTISESVLPFLGTGAAFHINGYTNCWTVDLSIEDCECAISIVITTTYVDCPTCAGYTSYKLTDCANSANVMYTSTDLSLYVGQVIEQDCPGCWFVEEFFLQPPSNTAIVVNNTFVNCATCEQTYYLLTDCAEIESNIITTTDLSINVGGFITLDWCPETCWEVSETREHTNSTVVFLKDKYVTCEECLIDVLPCTCQTATLINPCVYYNITVPSLFVGTITYIDCIGKIHDVEIPVHKDPINISFCGPQNQQFNVPYTVTDNANCNFLNWIDCNGDEQISRSGMLLNEISPKTCVKKWLMPEGQYEYIIYGDCTNVDNIFNCPIVPEIVRTVRPGYNTPTCTIDHYERIACSFADAMYSNALEKRYGITSCCPEDREKWELKYEIIEFAALVDPNYICTPVSTCCDPLPSPSPGSCNNQ